MVYLDPFKRHNFVKRFHFRPILIFLLVFAGPLTLQVFATPAPTDSRVTLTVEMVESRAAAAETDSNIDQETKALLAELYKKTISNLGGAKAFSEATDRYKSSIESDAERAETLRQESAEIMSSPDAAPLDTDGLTLPRIEQLLQKEKADLAAVEAKLAEFQTQVDRDRERPSLIRLRLNEAKAEKGNLETELSLVPEGVENDPTAQARRWSLLSGIEQMRSEIVMLDQELLSQPMRLDLLRAQRDRAEYGLGVLKERVAALEQEANRIRSEQTERAKTDALAAEKAAATKHPLVAEFAARNTALTQEIDELADAIDGINSDNDSAAERAQRISGDFNTTKQKIEIAGLSHVLGQVLHEQRRSLPDTRQFARQSSQREKRIATVTLSKIQLEEEQRELKNLPQYVSEYSSDLTPAQQSEIRDELSALAQSRVDLIDQALGIQRTYLAALGELEFTERRLREVVSAFDAFLDKRLLWIRSAQPVGLETAAQIPGQVIRLLTSKDWKNLAHTLGYQTTHSAWILLAITLAVVIMTRRNYLQQALKDSGANIGKLDQDRVSDTLRAFMYIFLLALPLPLLLFAIGWELRSSLEATSFTKDVGSGLMILAPLWFDLSGLKLMAGPHSVCHVHFKWRKEGLEMLVKDLQWFTPAVLVTGFIAILTLRTSDLAWGTGLGRLSFLILMVVFTVFFYRLAKPNGGTLSVFFADNQQSRMFKLRYLWFGVLVLSPIAAAIVSMAGYLYTAGTLIDHIMKTAWFTYTVIIVHQFFQRWLWLNQRKLRLAAARAKRQAEREARETTTESPGSGGSMMQVEEPEVDLIALDTTSRKLLNNAMLLAAIVGFWGIWRDMLPAFRIFNDITLWSYTKTVGEVAEVVPITLGSIGLAVLLLLITIAATRQLPALLEISLLQHLKVSPANRYTTITLLKYTVVAIGVAWVFSTLGGSWSEIQWIFAALGVGIGFGLQEIVANFISGLIILFERPIRVGDVVTVGTTDGVVTKIRIRATTIRNWNGQELLVPNKNFITQELLNWSLSDETTRLMIRVGVAYGSDVKQAMDIMERIANEHPRVLADPAPFTVFEEFGADSLNLTLRCFIDDLDYRIRTISELNLRVNELMQDAGIEIAFPQRDIHIDSKTPLDVRIQPQTSTDNK